MTDYIHCPNCDYICTKADLLKMDGLRCPSCHDEYWEAKYEGDEGWDNPMKHMTEEQILGQLEWQEEIKSKGTVQAIIDQFKPKHLFVVGSAPKKEDLPQ